MSELIRRSREISGYSLRAFAQSLETDPSAMAKLLKGKNRIGTHTIRKLGRSMALSEDEIEEFVEHRRNRIGAEILPTAKILHAGNYRDLHSDQFQIISDWYHLAILELTHVESFVPQPKWIARVLGISVAETNDALERLQRLGLLKTGSGKKWHDLSSGFTTNITAPNRNAAQRKFQKQVLERAITALETVPLAYRDQTGVTFAIDPDALPEIRERIKKFRRELDQFVSRGKKKEVYQISISLFPLSSAEKLGREK